MDNSLLNFDKLIPKDDKSKKVYDYSNIVYLYNNGWMQTNIAKIYNISRERVRQILNKYFTHEEIRKINKINYDKLKESRKRFKPNGKCLYCKKEIDIKRKYCSIKCCGNDKCLPPEVKYERHRKQMKEYNVRNREKIRIKQKLYFSKPEVKERIQKKAYERYKEKRNDPIAWEAYKKHMRKYNKRYYHNVIKKKKQLSS